MTADDLSAAFRGLPAAWREPLAGWTRERTEGVVQRVRRVSADRPIAPADPFRALRLVPPQSVRVVLLGQDPYPTAGHADGLAFSAAVGRPASLRRIFSVLAADRPGWRPPAHGALDAWAEQGVLLLNPVLTVEVGRIGSHLNCGWQALTSEIVLYLAKSAPARVAFMLWGARAQAFFDAALQGLDQMPQRVYRARHPSNDFHREFMAGQSDFLRTADLVDWWALGGPFPGGPVL